MPPSRVRANFPGCRKYFALSVTSFQALFSSTLLLEERRGPPAQAVAVNLVGLEASRDRSGIRSKAAATWPSLRGRISSLGQDRALIESKSHLILCMLESRTFLTRKSIHHLLAVILIHPACVSQSRLFVPAWPLM